jgi:hypothetical protein
MRKVILLIIASAMVVGGLYVVAAQLFWLPKIYFMFVFGADAVAAVGLNLLWEDFIAPMLGTQVGK